MLEIRCVWKSGSDVFYFNIILCVFVETLYGHELGAECCFFCAVIILCTQFVTGYVFTVRSGLHLS